jgi:23S rRNA (guanosine2251-2'-O)-methyltransferase
VSDIRRIVEPVLVNDAETVILHIDFSFDELKLGGSALAQSLNRLGEAAPTVTDAEYFADAFETIQELVNRNLILAGHDISTGGMLTTLLEMCFANVNGGLKVNLDAIGESNVVKILFSENPGVLIQVKNKKLVEKILQDAGIGFAEIAVPINEHQLLVQKNIEGAGKKVYAVAKKAGVPIRSVERKDLDRETGGKVHQGVAAYISEYEYSSMEDIYAYAERRGEPLFIVLLCGVEDPRNLGSIIRSAEGAGAHGVVIPTRRSAAVTPTVIKASAGAAVHMRVARVPNMVRCVEELKEKNVWVYGLDMDGTDYHETEFSGAAALAIGGEGAGLPRLVKEKCDTVVSVPMRGHISSLNAGSAAAIVLYEISYRTL